MRAEAIEELSRKRPPPASNLSKEEWKAMKDLKKDESIMVLPADKGKCLVVMDRAEYIEKMEAKLSDESTYKKLEEDPTDKVKAELAKKLQEVKDKGELDIKTYYRLQPTKTRIPRMYGQPKVHKENYPLREIVDSTGSVAKEMDRYISRIIKQYVGKTSHYVKNSSHFVTTIKDLRVEVDEVLVSYDVTALYPSVPQDEAIEIIRHIMMEDQDFAKKTTMKAESVIELFRICVKTTYFAFNKKLYQQIDGLAIGAASSGFAADLFMEKLEGKALSTFVSPPEIWKRYVDDTFSKLKQMFVNAFLEHLNQQHPRIKFTTETQENGKIAFLDTLVHVLLFCISVFDAHLIFSYDVTALYPSVPQDEAIEIIRHIMMEDQDFAKKTTMKAESVIELFRICVKTTYFAFNKKLYQQIDGLAIGAASSGFAADLFMEKLEGKALSTFVSPPEIWKRYVDDTFSKLKQMFVNAFLEHLNQQHPRIKFTTETQENGKIAFLDTLVHVLEDRSTKVTIYRKATHTDQYLDFRSNHHVKQKLGIISTFEHRVEELVTNEEDKKKEIRHVKKALKRCGHPNWALNRKKKAKKDVEKVERRGKAIIPYVKGMSENLAKIFKRYDLETIHKPSTTIRNLLCNKMKDKVEDLDKTGAVYYTNCKKHDDPKKDYVGETDRVTRSRLYEHKVIDHKTAKRSASIIHPGEKVEKKKPAVTTTRKSSRSNIKKRDYSALHSGKNQQLTEGSTEFSAHVATDVHSKDDLEYSILYTEDNWFKRGVKEAIAIRKIRPSLNLDDGRHHLSPMYNQLIKNSVAIKGPRQGTNGATVKQQQMN